MVRTTVYIPEDLKRELGQLAARLVVSEAELIRTALSRFIAAERPGRPRFPLFDGDDPTLAEHVDEALAEFGS